MRLQWRLPLAVALALACLTVSNSCAQPASETVGQRVDPARGRVLDLIPRVLEVKPKVLDLVGMNKSVEPQSREIGITVTDKQVRIQLAADVLFDFDKANIRPTAQPALKQVATVLRERAHGTVQIQGHTDSKGGAAYNQRLSERRAASVREWLIQHEGLGAMNFAIKGFGATRPVAPNTKPDGLDDPEGRQKNRRVEIVFGR